MQASSNEIVNISMSENHRTKNYMCLGIGREETKWHTWINAEYPDDLRFDRPTDDRPHFGYTTAFISTVIGLLLLARGIFMLRQRNWLVLIAFLAVTMGTAFGAETIGSDADAKTLLALATADLKAGDNDPQRTVAAALEYTQLVDYYKIKGDTDQVCDMQAIVYWCKKRMDQEALAAYLTEKGASAQANAARADEIVAANVPKDQADAYMARAHSFAKAHPSEFLEIAIHYFEVADRFVGTPVSLAAQRLSLDAQRKAVALGVSREDSIGKEANAQTESKADLPDAVKKAIEASNAAITVITSKGSANMEPEKQKAVYALLRVTAVEQKKGNLETLLAIQAQMTNMDVLQKGLSYAAQSVMDSFMQAKRRMVDKVNPDIVTEKRKLLASLGKIQADEVRKGNTSSAKAIKGEMWVIRAETAAREALYTTQDLDAWTPVSREVMHTWVFSASCNPDNLVYAIDGDLSSRWDSGTSQTPGQYVQVDLTKSWLVAGIVLNCQGNTDYPRGWEISISDDGTTWSRSITKGTGIAGVMYIPFPKNTITHFLRITQTGSTDKYWAINEFSLLGEPGP
jgi:hypothetical protein